MTSCRLQGVVDVIVLEPARAEDSPLYVGFHRHAGDRSSWPGGRPQILLPPEAPSRAYLKVEEAIRLANIPMRAGDVAVEIGAAPGGVAYAHIHVGFELILYILEGKVRHEFGPGLKQVLENEAGDFIYIKPDVPHEVFNMSNTQPVVAFVARSSASEWDDIIPYDRNERS